MKNLPISYKFLGIITVLILLMLFLLGSNYITYQSLTEESALRTLGNSTEQAAAELDTYFSDLSHLSLVPMSQKYDSYDFAHIIEESSSGSKAFNADAVLDDMLQKLLSYKPSLQSIMLAFPDGSVNCVMPNYWHLQLCPITGTFIPSTFRVSPGSTTCYIPAEKPNSCLHSPFRSYMTEKCRIKPSSPLSVPSASFPAGRSWVC